MLTNQSKKNAFASVKAVQKKSKPGHPSETIKNNRPEAVQLQEIQQMSDASPMVSQLRSIESNANSAVSQLQSDVSTPSNSDSETIQAKENSTGLPDTLKSGIENLSGYSMDDVKVHYNSDQPAQLQAHAFAQGTDIHVGQGQEKHLPHEAWHVVQQKQGRVKPTKQLKSKVAINDDAGLEKEADMMGAKALQMKATSSPEIESKGASNAIQREVDTSSSPSLTDTKSIDAIDKQTSDKSMAIANEDYLKEHESEKGDANTESDLGGSEKEDLDVKKRTSRLSGLGDAMKNAAGTLGTAFEIIKGGTGDFLNSAKESVKSGMANMASAAKQANAYLLPLTKRLNSYKEKIEKMAGGAGKLLIAGIKQIPVIGSIIGFIMKASKSSVRFGDYMNFTEAFEKLSNRGDDFFEGLKFSATKAWRGFLKSVTSTISSALGIVDDVIALSTAGLGGVIKIFKGLLGLIPALLQSWTGFKKKFILKNLSEDRIKYTRLFVQKALDGDPVAKELLIKIDPSLDNDESLKEILESGAAKKGYYFDSLNSKFGSIDENENVKKSALFMSMDSKNGSVMESAGAAYDLSEGSIAIDSNDSEFHLANEILDKTAGTDIESLKEGAESGIGTAASKLSEIATKAAEGDAGGELLTIAAISTQLPKKAEEMVEAGKM